MELFYRHPKLIVTLILSLIAILIYFRATGSRRYYTCAECGESFRVELMEASHCKTCGAPVNESYKSNVKDKA